jgi:purine catabolism regulator
VVRLSDANVAALAIGDQMYAPPLAPRTLREAEERTLPILFVRREVPFIALAQTVAAANRDALHARLANHLRVYETLAAVARSETDIPALFERLSALSGYDLYALTAIGTPLFPGLRDPPAAVPASALHETRSLSGRPVEAWCNGRRAFLLPIVAKRLAIGVVLAIERPSTEADQLVLHHIATIASLLAAELLHDREQQRREGSERLTRLLTEPPERWAGWIPALFPDAAADADLCFAVVRLAEDAEGWNDLHHHLLDHGVEHVLARRGREGLVLGIAASAARFAALVADGLPGSAVGVGRPASVGSDPQIAREQAVYALRHALARETRAHVFGSNDEVGWLPLDSEALELLARGVLGRVVAHDEAADVSLEETLRVFLQENRRWKPAADRLRIHRQTLVYRIRKIEQLTGRKLSRTNDVCDLWLALQARDAASVR